MYERFFGLRERPFDLTPNPRYLYLTPRHREALSTLQYGITGRKGITVLVGEAGTGKTTLVRAALDAVAGPSVRCVYVSNPALTRLEFYEFLAPKFGFGDRASASKARFLVELEESVHARHESGGLTALIIDEAQSLPHELMEEVRLLANFESATEKLLPVVLAGQPELDVRLEHEELRQLKQRVALRCELAPLDIRETAAYIAGRIAIAGGDSARIFTREAVQTIYERSLGIPRTISVLCDNALLTGFAVGVKPIGSNIVLEVCRDFRLAGFKESSSSGRNFGPVDTAERPEALFRANAGDGRRQGPPSATAHGRGGADIRPIRPDSARPAPSHSRAGRGESQPRQADDGMFSSYSKKKRFSFF